VHPVGIGAVAGRPELSGIEPAKQIGIGRRGPLRPVIVCEEFRPAGIVTVPIFVVCQLPIGGRLVAVPV